MFSPIKAVRSTVSFIFFFPVVLSLFLISCGGSGSGTTHSDNSVLIESEGGSAQSPQIAIDGDGNALAVWIQDDGSRYSIRANRYTAGSGWGSAELIENNDPGADMAWDPQIAIDNDGNALAVWSQYVASDMHYDIWANRYTAGIGWGSPELIEIDDTGDASDPQVAFDGAGNALAVWKQNYSTYANRYDAASSNWGSAELIESGAGNVDSPQIAVDSSGNALAVWFQYNGSRSDVWANRYDAAGGSWGTAVLIESNDAGSARYPQIAFDSNGNALAVWHQSSGSGYYIWTNRYDAMSSSWGSAERIGSNPGDDYFSQIAIDSSGNALVVWEGGNSSVDIWANRYDAAGDSWGSAELIESNEKGSAYSPQIAIDGAGNAVAVWYQYDGSRNNIWANRYTAGSGWGSAKLIENDNRDNAWEPQIAIGGDGSAIAVWYQSDGSRTNILAYHFE